jgi:uncharacterized membrane protein
VSGTEADGRPSHASVNGLRIDDQSGRAARQTVPSLPPRVWAVVLVLCAIAVIASIRRLGLLSGSGGSGASADLDALFAAKASLTRGHILPGLLLVLLIPIQLSTAVRRRWPGVHRWLGRLLMVAGLGVGLTGYAMVAIPIGGALEVSAIVVYATAFLVSLLMAWIQIRRGHVARHREWMIRSLSVALGLATTRPVVGVFFASRALTGLTPSQFFGVAFWIGFSATALAGEFYVRRTRT